MTAHIPLTLGPEIQEELGVILQGGGRLYDVTDPQWIALLEKTDKLQKQDTVAASSYKATLYSLVGDLAQVAYWVNNMRLNGDKIRSDETESHCLANLGFATRAAQIFPRIMELQRGHVNMYLHRGITSACFQAVDDASNVFIKAGGKLDPENVHLLNLARSATAALEQLSVSESMVQRMMDKAGDIMRAEKLLWLDDHADVDASTGPGAHVSIRYRIAVTADRAAHLNWDLAESLAEVDLMPLGVTVSFTGTQALAQAA